MTDRPPILDFDQSHKVRFTSALFALDGEGWDALKLGVVPDKIKGGNVICVKISGFNTMFREPEVRDIVKVCARVDSLPKESRRFVEALKMCADDAKGADITAEEKARMI